MIHEIPNPCFPHRRSRPRGPSYGDYRGRLMSLTTTANQSDVESLATDKLADLLAARYASPAWAIFFEVSNATGYKANRHADAVAVGIWPSRGLSILGFEIKASRSDWKHELSNPRKADAIFKYCDHWFLVANPNVAEL